ncbi:G-type lectin S-receptor-like serine/threonine-protein kinase At4g27290 [Helianthus annuus]|uniref:G-type lectin S-receptor-like serine/threonine-protein kinase At4g27290 n=1 Tax=Helianthus annuus TaxID=4232 RepID=UPI000B8F3CE4|nr:G-type lectin S-receptor-like serine/threonine-protein kinase At4g27290 [Helianthus annuus]
MRALARLLFFSSALFSVLLNSAALDTINTGQALRDDDTLVSAGETYELGFFSPGNSKNRYLGIWFKKIGKITKISSVSVGNTPVVAKLLDSGNLVVCYDSSTNEDFVWQSFDYPTDTLLAGMKLGKDLVTGVDRYLTSWKSMDDPSPGLYVSWMDTNGYPQAFQKRGSVLQLRFGPWTGVRFSGFPSKPNPIYTYDFVFNEKEVYSIFHLINNSIMSRVYLSPEGKEMRLNWIDPAQGWMPYLVTTVDMCAQYGLCGAYGICNINSSPACSCMEGFEPRFPVQWNAGNWSGGCQREKSLNCGNKDAFRKLSGVKFYHIEGVMEDGREIAVKRLSETSTQGLDEFMNEVRCIHRLQHRNLVKLLGFCAQKHEIMLIYEYMPNRSLDTFLFDETKGSMLDWTKRFHIINGIARGLLYLHQDSCLRIIHRDLKATNILLDTTLTSKISDFGLARRFKGYETRVKTKNVVGTYGYIPPEYAVHGVFSVKSDVFSFSVLVLEIVSGMKKREFSSHEHLDNLLGHAWRLYKDGKCLDLVGAPLLDSCVVSKVLRSIHIGLLCVQNHAEDRPTMSSVVLMLGNDGVLSQPKSPAFFTGPELKLCAHTRQEPSVNNNRNPQSGASEATIMRQATEEYCRLYKKRTFPHVGAWEVARHHPKWVPIELVDMCGPTAPKKQGGSKRSKTSDSGNYTTSARITCPK